METPLEVCFDGASLICSGIRRYPTRDAPSTRAVVSGCRADARVGRSDRCAGSARTAPSRRATCRPLCAWSVHRAEQPGQEAKHQHRPCDVSQG